MPEVSVILPAYNASLTIKDTIKSILNQSYKDFELIIINDGSTDETEEIIKSFDDKRIILNKIKNSGASAARNKGIEIARGDYVSFIDSDDLWSIDKLEKQLGLLSNNKDYSVAYSWTMYIDEKGDYIHPMKAVTYEGDVYQKIILNNFVGSGSNILVRKNILDKTGIFNIKLTYGEEWDLLIRLSRNCKFALVKEYQIFYRQSLFSLSSSIEDMEKDITKIIENTYKNAPEEIFKLKNKSLSSMNSYLSYLYLTKQNIENWKLKSILKSTYSIYLNLLSVQNLKTLLIVMFIIIIYLVPSRYCLKMVTNIIKIYGKTQIFLNKHIREGCFGVYSLF